MYDLGRHRLGVGAEHQNLLAHEVALAALARDLGQRLGPVLGVDRRRVFGIATRVLRLETATDDAYAVLVQIQRARQVNRSRWHRVATAVVLDDPSRPYDHGKARDPLQYSVFADHSVTDGVANQLCGGTEAELAHHVALMELDRLARDTQHVGDGLCRVPLANQLQDLTLA